MTRTDKGILSYSKPNTLCKLRCAQFVDTSSIVASTFTSNKSEIFTLNNAMSEYSNNYGNKTDLGSVFIKAALIVSAF